MNVPLRALLLTDVVDSTRLSHALGDEAMARLWTEHDRAARDLLRDWHGHEIEKTDGLLALFETVADAVGFAAGYHRALSALGVPLNARVGIHAGAMTLRETSADDAALGAKRVEVDGLVKPITARVMATALGGQTLLTGDARAALGATALRVSSHGHWRLKGVPEPIELFEIGEPGAPFTPPPDAEKSWRVVRQRDLWLPVREVRHSLPAERDSFVGRSEPLQILARKLEEGARLVSVLGMGGTGKTRFVARFAWSWLGEYPGGVWFCDLSQARTVDGIHVAVSQGLDVPLGKTDPVVQLGRAIAGRGRCLVVLDNFEQVARHAEETLGHWLDRAPLAQFIVTTREVLGIVGEETLALVPLPGADAAALFLRRAESARQGYAPGPDDLAAIHQLVKVLDGLPLAIELAAARVRVLSPRALLERMHERFSVLWSRAGRQDRQATLRAAFDWSWELLSDPEKSALAQLAVFQGGFTLESAEAVLDLSAHEHAPDVIDALNWLIDKSFVRPLGDDRFDLLESVREYAMEHLQTAGRFAGSGPDAQRAALQRHGRFFAALGPLRAAQAGGIELDNLVAACRRAVQRGDPGVAAPCLHGAWGPLRMRGPFRLGVTLAATVRTMSGLQGADRAQVDLVEGLALHLCGSAVEAQQRLEIAIDSAQAVGRPDLQARALQALAMLQAGAGQLDDAGGSYRRALEAVRRTGDRSQECAVLNGIASFSESLGDIREAREHYALALRIARETGDRRWEGGSAGNLAGWHATHGDPADALPLYLESIAIARELGDRQWEANAHCNLGLLHYAEGAPGAARGELETALTAAREMGHARLLCIVQCNLALVAESLGEPQQALTYYEEAIDLARDLHDRRSEGQFLGYLGRLHARQRRFDAADICLETGEALLRAVSDRISLGILLCGTAEAESLRGRPERAEQVLAQASRIAGELDDLRDESEFGKALARTRSLLGALADRP
jgi:predicted ATPase/class 3 adenylate cyclase/Tfp pilus assembly protein PilF